MTGFSPRVRKLVRTRAGNGYAEQACCESCGIWLGEHGGQIQHRVARGQGGSKDPVINGPANATLMCGTPFSGCHGLAESRKPEHRMEDRGFVIKHGAGPEFDPRFVPLVLLGGVEVWLSETEPRYLYEAPIGVAA
jgi:hypothetical protein